MRSVFLALLAATASGNAMASVITLEATIDNLVHESSLTQNELDLLGVDSLTVRFSLDTSVTGDESPGGFSIPVIGPVSVSAGSQTIYPAADGNLEYSWLNWAGELAPSSSATNGSVADGFSLMVGEGSLPEAGYLEMNLSGGNVWPDGEPISASILNDMEINSFWLGTFFTDVWGINKTTGEEEILGFTGWFSEDRYVNNFGEEKPFYSYSGKSYAELSEEYDLFQAGDSGVGIFSDSITFREIAEEQISPVPLPAGGFLLMSLLSVLGIFKMHQRRTAIS